MSLASFIIRTNFAPTDDDIEEFLDNHPELLDCMYVVKMEPTQATEHEIKVAFLKSFIYKVIADIKCGLMEVVNDEIKPIVKPRADVSKN
jgi:hypothetical protein